VEDGRQRLTGTDLYLLRTRLDFLMLHAMMLRGESTRKAELADLCSVLLPDEGSECLRLVLRTNAGKMSDWCLEVPSGNSVVATVYYVRRCCMSRRGKLSCT
jgi:hypothetical protein